MKAFKDTGQDCLLNKCKNLSIDSEWFDRYLEGRMQSVRLGYATSRILWRTQHADNIQFIHPGNVRHYCHDPNRERIPKYCQMIF